MAKQYQCGGLPSEDGRPSVFIAVPSSDGKIHPNCVVSLMAVPQKLAAHGMGFRFFLEAGNCHVDDARNSCVRAFLMSDCTHLLFIDADVGFDPDAVPRLLRLTKDDIVAGVYPKKSDEEDYPVRVIPGTDLMADKDGLVEVLGAPTGFMCIPRAGVEELCERHKDKRFNGQQASPNDPPYHVIFERLLLDGNRLSGDYAFCTKWRALKRRVLVDPEQPFTHEGPTEWGGTLADHWKRKHGVYDALFDQAIANLLAGTPFPEDWINLTKGWGNEAYSATPPLLQAAYHTATRAKGPILECGSGLSTLVLACAARHSGYQVITLEDSPIWGAHVYKKLVQYGLHVDLRIREIASHGEFKWYADAGMIPECAVVLCDGPPRTVGREGLFRLYGESIKIATIIMDDTDDWVQSKLIEGRGRVINFGKFSISQVQT